ncbi:MAG TPA: M20 family metallopeptidase [Firmicutes bacterium]|nr:M20 family metallopeptidase [Candidatus Fermentithermobacillaceae bacterium]
MDMEALRHKLREKIELLSPMVENVARSLYEHPELGLEEVFASRKIAEILERHGFSVEYGVAGMKTAFRASKGRGKPVVAFMAEYDALPEIGHGCGHNLIASVALAAGIACSDVISPETAEVTWVVLGTPAEETIGGKIIMAEAGVFDDIDVAFIAHPGQRNSVGGESWASWPVEITFRGQASHAGANPQGGVNALDALVQAYIGIRNLRNSLDDSVRIPGVITHGGDAPNVVPDKATARFSIRAKTSKYLEEVLIPRIRTFAEGIAKATGTVLEFSHYEPLFRETLKYPQLQEIVERNWRRLGVEISREEGGPGGGVTDVGAVTWRTPAIQIGFRIGDVRGHTREFAQATVSEAGIQGALLAAKVLVLSALDVVASPGVIDEMKRRLSDVQNR